MDNMNNNEKQAEQTLSLDPRKRFSNRVALYIRYRPGYPPEIIDLLKERIGFDSSKIVADIGSGTGILTRLFLENGNRVYGVEPNKEMREAGEEFLKAYPAFRSVDASAEETGLPDQSVDLVTAGQAFHWFDPAKARVEFKRILKPGGYVFFIWNERNIEKSAFVHAYEQLLLDFAFNYANEPRHGGDRELITHFFAGSAWQQVQLENSQEFDFEGLKGRLLSSSYAPLAGHPNYEPMIARLREIFDTYQTNGRVSFPYDTDIYFAQLLD
jgi:SAM-dependent methyltransferase